jgi:hypothetical protein
MVGPFEERLITLAKSFRETSKLMGRTFDLRIPNSECSLIMDHVHYSSIKHS